MNNRLTPAKRMAMELFRDWRTAGYAMKVDAETANTLTNNMVDLGDADSINLSTLAVKYAIILTKKVK